MKPKTSSRVAWSVGLASAAMLLGTLALMFADRHASLPSDSSGHWNFSNVLNTLVNIAVPTIGIVLASRRPTNPIGWLFLGAGLSLGISQFGTSYGLHALVADPGSLPAGRAFAWAGNWVGLVPLGFLAFLLMLFPTGHLPSPRWRPVGRFMAGAFTVIAAANLVFAIQVWNDPFNQTSSANLLGFVLFAFPLLGSLAVALAAVIVRFRRSVGDERLQLKWFVTGAALVVVSFIASFFSTSSPPPVISVLQSAAFIVLYTAIGIAVLKYRLYEIDVVISKTVVYGVLAAFFTAVYVAVVVGIGTAIGSTHNPFLTVLAAALIALAFNPVRDRAKRFADRIAYGKRATPYEVLSEFAERVAGTYATEDVLPRMARILAEATAAVRADVWLRVGPELRSAASWPAAAPAEPVRLVEAGPIVVPGASAVVPVRHQGDVLGALSVQKAPGDPVSRTEDKLLADVASQAGLVLRNVRLIEDLRASRQRIVAAQDAAARRLERNIHDGAQQQLVALSVKANLARSLARTDPARTEEMLSQLRAEAQSALENLRDLARGIYPPLLADQGLVAALTAQARKSPVPVRVEAEGIGRFSEDAEAAVYFCALEALQNVAKYAEASLATVRLVQTDGHLDFEVTDDGVGFDIAARGSGTGTQGMADRLAALGGELAVTSSPGAGTTVRGRLPVAVAEAVSEAPVR